MAKRSHGSSLTSEFKLTKWGYMDDSVLEAWIHLYIAYTELAPQLCSRVEEYARLSYKMCVGESVTFDKHAGRLMGKGVHEVELLGRKVKVMVI